MNETLEKGLPAESELSSPEAQSVFKKLQRVTIVTNVLMGAVTVLALSMAIYASTLNPWESKSWTEIFFFILVGVIVAYFAFVAVWEVLMRRKQAAILHAFVARTFYSAPAILKGADGAFEIIIVGDKLTVMREGRSGAVQADLSPVSNYTSVCAAIERLTKKFIAAYYYAAAIKGEIRDIKVVNRVRKNEKVFILYKGDEPIKDKTNDYFIKNGLIKQV